MIRKFARHLLLLALLLPPAAALAAKPLPWVEGSQTLAFMPDTQYLTKENMSSGKSFRDRFPAMTKWLARRKEERNILYVLHLGDVVQDNLPGEWQVARSAFDSIEGKIPYVIMPGNHDYSYADGGRTTLLNEYFSYETTSKWPSFGGAFEEGRLDNTYHLLSIQDRPWIVAALECSPRNEVVAWANDVLARHKDRQAIVMTHAYLQRDGNWLKWAGSTEAENDDPMARNDGEQLWNKLVRRHANIMVAICGHKPGEAYTPLKGDHGNTVHQILVDYQSGRGGGNGYMRLLEFHPDGETVQCRTFSPYTKQYRTGELSQFVFKLAR